MIIAFGVVAATVLANTLVEAYRRTADHKRQAMAMRRALLAELRVHHHSLQGSLERANDPEPGGSFIVPVIEKYPVYQTSLATIGLLSPTEVDSVVGFYSLAAAEIETLSVIGTVNRGPGGNLTAIVDSNFSPVLAGHAKHLGDAAAKAIAQLEANS